MSLLNHSLVLLSLILVDFLLIKIYLEYEVQLRRKINRCERKTSRILKHNGIIKLSIFHYE